VIDRTSGIASDDRTTVVPSVPILVSRTDTTMTFRPVRFNPSSGEKVFVV